MGETSNGLLRQMKSMEAQNQELRARLEEATEALRAISTGEVDALVVYGEEGERIYTLQGADYAYRVMVESIHEGAANITPDGAILYCNKTLAEMLNTPLQQVLGSSFSHYLMPSEQEIFTALIARGLENYGRAELYLGLEREHAIPVLVTASAAEVDSRRGLCLVITDLSDQKQALARERELRDSLARQREDERVRIARNLHDGPLQDLIGLSYIVHSVMENCDAEEIAGLREDLVDGIQRLIVELRDVSNELRPAHTIRFGLAKAIYYHSQDFQERHPGLAINLELADDGLTIPTDISTALFHIYQQAVNNIVRHAEASSVEIRLILGQDAVFMEVQDDGKGFQPPEYWVELSRGGHLGLVGMRERAEALGGKLTVISGECKGTTIQVEVPLPPASDGSE